VKERQGRQKNTINEQNILKKKEKSKNNKQTNETIKKQLNA